MTTIFKSWLLTAFVFFCIGGIAGLLVNKSSTKALTTTSLSYTPFCEPIVCSQTIRPTYVKHVSLCRKTTKEGNNYVFDCDTKQEYSLVFQDSNTGEYIKPIESTDLKFCTK